MTSRVVVTRIAQPDAYRQNTVQLLFSSHTTHVQYNVVNIGGESKAPILLHKIPIIHLQLPTPPLLPTPPPLPTSFPGPLRRILSERSDDGGVYLRQREGEDDGLERPGGEGCM